MTPRLFTYPTLASTSDTAADLLAAGEVPPFAVLAAAQTAGRGQRGRAWDSPPGNLYLTYALPRRRDAVPLAGFAAALAVREALIGFLPHPAAGPDAAPQRLHTPPQRLRLKWPNDVLLDGRKVAGLLLENREAGLLVGIGINLAATPAGATRWPAGCLADSLLAPALPPEPRVVQAALTEPLLRWLAASPEAVCAAWTDAAWGVGQEIVLETDSGPLLGILLGIAADGRLQLQTEDGERLMAAGRMVPTVPAAAAVAAQA